MSTLATSHEGLGRIAGDGAEAASRSVASLKALAARMFERLRQHRQDRLFEQLMQQDPRVYADIQAAAARQDAR